jgi:hypothetical protein
MKSGVFINKSMLPNFTISNGKGYLAYGILKKEDILFLNLFFFKSKLNNKSIIY